VHTQLTDKGYLAAGGSTVWGPISLDGLSTVTVTGSLISISGTGQVKHDLEISYDGETWTTTTTSITQTTAPGYTTSSLSGCAAAAVRLRSTATAVFYTCGLSISRN
jgi:hypothetical protein